jgi:hypothetical protein
MEINSEYDDWKKKLDGKVDLSRRLGLLVT